VVRHPEHDRAVVAKADRRAVLPLLKHVVAEHGLYDLAVRPERAAASARVRLDRLQRQTELFGDAVEFAQRGK